jgi:hypothetical protein
VEREGRTIALLLAGFKVVEKPPNVGEKKVADLGLLVNRRVDLRKRVL